MFKKLALLLAVIAASAVATATARAQSPRTFVSATGTNNSQCSATSPCQTFAQAIAVTNNGGVINCLTPGSFGAVTISISVTIDCEGASSGGISANSGAAIAIGTSSVVVNLIGLDLDGERQGGAQGVSVTAAATVNIRNCKINSFTYGILFNPGTSGGTLLVDNVFLTNNHSGIYLQSTDGASNMSVRNSTVSNSFEYGIFVQVIGGTHAGATIEQTTLAFTTDYGLYVSGTGAVAVLGSSTVVNNGTGVSAQSGGILYSFKNNQIGGNVTDGTPLTAYPGGPLN